MYIGLIFKFFLNFKFIIFFKTTSTNEKTFVFKDFRATMANMQRIAFEAEDMNHHPEWFNVYNKLVVDLMTHDASGITENDTKLAKILNSL